MAQVERKLRMSAQLPLIDHLLFSHVAVAAILGSGLPTCLMEGCRASESVMILSIDGLESHTASPSGMCFPFPVGPPLPLIATRLQNRQSNTSTDPWTGSVMAYLCEVLDPCDLLR